MINIFLKMGLFVQAFILVVFIGIIVYLIYRRLKEKEDETYEDRDN